MDSKDLTEAMRYLVEAGVLPRIVDDDTYTRNWQAVEHILAMAEKRGEERAVSNLASARQTNYASGVAHFTGVLTCLVDGCENRAYGLSLYCPKHRRRMQRHGDPTVTMKRGRKARDV